MVIPDELIQAWLFIMLAVALSRQNNSGWQDYMSEARKLIEKGTQKIMFPSESILFPSKQAVAQLFKQSVVQPRDLAALLLSKLVQKNPQPKSSASAKTKPPGLDLAMADANHLRGLVSENRNLYDDKTTNRTLIPT